MKGGGQVSEVQTLCLNQSDTFHLNRYRSIFTFDDVGCQELLETL